MAFIRLVQFFFCFSFNLQLKAYLQKNTYFPQSAIGCNPQHYVDVNFKSQTSAVCEEIGWGVFGWTWQHNVPLIRGLAHRAQSSNSQYGPAKLQILPNLPMCPCSYNVTLQQCFNVFVHQYSNVQVADTPKLANVPLLLQCYIATMFQCICIPIFQCADWRYSQTCVSSKLCEFILISIFIHSFPHHPQLGFHI